MEANTLVFLMYPQTQYLVAEPVEEVKRRWLDAQDEVLDGKSAVVELTCITGVDEPYPLIVNAGYITSVEYANEVVVGWSLMKGRERREELQRELSEKPTGFAV